jgi:argininosuccinate synthase
MLCYALSMHKHSSRPQPRKIALAYSGGLDTSIIVPWLKEQYPGTEVVCVAADIGQGDGELNGVREKALASGASECYVEDLRKEFVEQFLWPMLRAGAIYSRKYLLGTSVGRPLIARRQVEVARQVGADALAHGCTGKGNDQVRFELTYMAFAPDLPVIAPWREWNIRSREDAIAYAEAHNVPVTATREKIYSRDRNLWHISHEGGALEDPANGAPADLFILTNSPELAPDTPEQVSITFEAGTPVAINGEKMDAVPLVATLNKIGGRHGVGRIDLIEDRLVGMKSRGVYETPGGTLLYAAHSELEQLVLDRRTLAAKDVIASSYADLVYEGRWWTTERESYDAFVSVTQQYVSGTVTLKLYKGSVTPIARESAFALYDERFVTFGADDVYEQSDAAGFIRLYGLSERVRALHSRERAEERSEKAEAPIDAKAPSAAKETPATKVPPLAKPSTTSAKRTKKPSVVPIDETLIDETLIDESTPSYAEIS